MQKLAANSRGDLAVVNSIAANSVRYTDGGLPRARFF
mgnify:CR=1 FL=1